MLSCSVAGHCLVAFVGLGANKIGRTACIVVSLARHLPEFFRIPSPTSLFEQCIPLTEGYFLWLFPTKSLTKSSHCKFRFLFGIGCCDTHFTETPFFTPVMLAPLVARYGNSTNPVSVRDNITHLNTFCVRSYALQNVSNITFKLSAFYVFKLHHFLSVFLNTYRILVGKPLGSGRLWVR